MNADALSGAKAGMVPWPRHSAASHEDSDGVTAIPESRFSDRRQGRLSGVTLSVLIHLLLAAVLLFKWVGSPAKPHPPTLNVFNVAPPAAPPVQVVEVPPGPPQREKKEAVPEAPERPMMDPPQIILPQAPTVPVSAPRPVADPGPPVEKTTAPEVRPAPPAPDVSNAKPNWEGMVLGALNKARRYPSDARYRRQQGVPYIRFTIDRQGRVLSSRLERSSGFRALDDEAVGLPKRASPLPRPPAEVKGETIELVVPVEFFLGGRR